MIDKLWAAINSRNGSVPVRNGIYKDYDIPLFNEDVIREALNNAIAHRAYDIQGEIVVKQYPTQMIFVNPGGFPHESPLTISSMFRVPRETGFLQMSSQRPVW